MKIAETKLNNPIKAKAKSRVGTQVAGSIEEGAFSQLLPSSSADSANPTQADIAPKAVIATDVGLHNISQEAELHQANKKTFVKNAKQALTTLKELKQSLIFGTNNLQNLNDYNLQMQEIKDNLKNYDDSLLEDDLKEIKLIAEEIRIRSAIEIIKLQKNQA